MRTPFVAWCLICSGLCGLSGLVFLWLHLTGFATQCFTLALLFWLLTLLRPRP